MACREADLERRIDLLLLKANVAGILISLEMKESWRHNPLLYLKIAFIGLDHALTKPAGHTDEREERSFLRLQAIPALLRQGMDNLKNVPEAYCQAAMAMVNDCKAYLKETGKGFAGGAAGQFAEGLEKAWASLEAFDHFLKILSPLPNKEVSPVVAMEASLKNHFLCTRTLEEIFEIGKHEWHKSLRHLQALQKKIDPDTSWQALYHAYCPEEVADLDTLSLYRREIDRLGTFFRNVFCRRRFSGPNPTASLRLCETPGYLRSVRGTASFSAAFSADPEEEYLFYLTTDSSQQRGRAGNDQVRKRLHREYRFLTAHETFPGHYLLDAVRRGLENPVRRQIESPLFYEGWASYAESLLIDYGYTGHALDRLVAWKRRLWRAARCQIDVGLNTGELNREDAIELLTTVGFSEKEAAGHIDRFALNPGYQLCYTLGRHEIASLRKTFEKSLGRDGFHQCLLEGGELPFHLAAKRLAMKSQAKP